LLTAPGLMLIVEFLTYLIIGEFRSAAAGFVFFRQVIATQVSF